MDLKARMLANGHDDMDMQSVIKLATSRWNKLSTCEKEVYKVKAQNSPDIDLKPARRKRKDLDDLLKNLCKPASEPDEADLDLLMMKEITLVVNNAAELKGERIILNPTHTLTILNVFRAGLHSFLLHQHFLFLRWQGRSLPFRTGDVNVQP